MFFFLFFVSTDFKLLPLFIKSVMFLVLIQAIMYTKWLGVDLESAIERPRIHDQLVPTEAKYEAGFNSVSIKAPLI